MIPPRWLRRVVLGPFVLALAVLVATTLPITALIAVAASPLLPGRWRPLRLLWFALVFLFVEAAGLLVCFVLWVASGFGWRLDAPRLRAAHEMLVRWYLAIVVGQARRTFRLRFHLYGPTGRQLRLPQRRGGALAVAEPPHTRRPLLVLARHAGPGDSFLLVYALTRLRRHPRIVLKAALQWAPCLDVVLNRLPAAFVGGGASRADVLARIGQLAGGLGPDDGLVLFPEGGNFTERRRLRSIAKLEELGRHEQAEHARAMRYLLAPRAAGVLAALHACPEADVVFVAHTGLEDLSSPVDLWRGLPMDSTIDVRIWRVTAAEIPEGDDAREAWLYGWWRTIDAWILERRGEVAVPDAVVADLRAHPAPPDPTGRPRSSRTDPPSP